MASCATEAPVDRLEAQLTVFRGSSEVSYVNASAGNQAVNISRSLDLLALCKRLYGDTMALRRTAGPLTRCWGFPTKPLPRTPK